MSEVAMPTRERVFAAINDYRIFYDYPPSLRDLCVFAQVKSTSSVRYHLDRLRAEGRITWDEGKTRTVRVVGAAA